MAQFRVEKWRESLTAFQRARELSSEHGPDHFFRAMAHWKLGEQEKARRNYDAGARWLETRVSPDKKTLCLRNDAASMLRIENGAAGMKREHAPKPSKKP
jgi:hypothetical protein